MSELNHELREIIGKAIYAEESKQLEALDIGSAVPWNELLEETREDRRKRGEQAIEAYKAWIDEHIPSWFGIAGIEASE